MAEMFLKLDGIEGESLDSVHSGEIEIINWTWENKNVVKWDQNQGGQSTRVDVGELSVTKFCDKASPTLQQNCVTGKHIRSGTITCRKNDGDQKVEYLVVKLTDIMISKVHWDGDGGDQSLKEQIGLSFAEFRVDYKLQQDTGNAGGVKGFGFNVQKQISS
jgi:type VI secretion system secreted protein Hcp